MQLKFRLGNDTQITNRNWEIHNTPNTNKNKILPYCKNLIDEIRFLLKCPLYNDSRNEFFTKLSDS